MCSATRNSYFVSGGTTEGNCRVAGNSYSISGGLFIESSVNLIANCFKCHKRSLSFHTWQISMQNHHWRKLQINRKQGFHIRRHHWTKLQSNRKPFFLSGGTTGGKYKQPETNISYQKAPLDENLEQLKTVISYQTASLEELVEQPETVISFQETPLEETVEQPETVFSYQEAPLQETVEQLETVI